MNTFENVFKICIRNGILGGAVSVVTTLLSNQSGHLVNAAVSSAVVNFSGSLFFLMALMTPPTRSVDEMLQKAKLLNGALVLLVIGVAIWVTLKTPEYGGDFIWNWQWKK